MILKKPLKWISLNQAFGHEFITPDHPKGFYSDMGLLGHNGEDYRASTGAEVFASHDGDVVWAGSGGYGVLVYLRGKDEKLGYYKTNYAHLKAVNVLNGQQVKAGDLIGWADNTGPSTGPHLHFGLLPLNNDMSSAKYPNNGYFGWVDPAPYLDPDFFKLPIDLRYGNPRNWNTYLQEVKAVGVLSKVLRRLPKDKETIAMVYGGWRAEDIANVAMWEPISFLSRSEYLLGKPVYHF